MDRMEELILPLVRTVFLPPGSPGIGSINQILADLRDVRCGMSGDEVYCFGEADILVDYVSCRHPGDLFAGAANRFFDRDAAAEWQAMLSFPFQLKKQGHLPADLAYRINLHALNWNMVTSRAIELEAEVRITYEMPQSEYTEEAEYGRLTNQKGGEWKMVSVYDEKEYAQNELFENTADCADPTVAEETLPQNVPTVEVVDLAGDTDHAVQDAILQVIRAHMPIHNVSAETTPAVQPEVPAAAETLQADGTAEEPVAVQYDAVQEDVLQKEAVEEVGGVLSTDIPAPDSAVNEAEEDTEDAEYEAETEEHEDPSVESVTDIPGLSVVWEATAEVLQPAEDEPLKAVEMVAAVPEPVEVTETRPAKTHKKRRFGGIPGLYVEANNNDIDLTAFKINIKL